MFVKATPRLNTICQAISKANLALMMSQPAQYDAIWLPTTLNLMGWHPESDKTAHPMYDPTGPCVCAEIDHDPNGSLPGPGTGNGNPALSCGECIRRRVMWLDRYEVTVLQCERRLVNRGGQPQVARQWDGKKCSLGAPKWLKHTYPGRKNCVGSY